MTSQFSAKSVLARLKDFQRRTVEYAFRRMFLDPDPVSRFLVADEVGLGKTMVAQGVIAKAVEHLQGHRERINIVYICSNADIAAQNVSRLNVTGDNAFVKATRLTLLPLEVKRLRDKAINFISFTPGTTFDHGRRGGHKRERKLIFQMLQDRLGISAKGLAQVLQGAAGAGWYTEVTESLDYDEPIAVDFRSALGGSPILARLRALADHASDYRRSMTPQHLEEARELTSELRRMLARCCLGALEPDLVILDEFQRFRDLLAAPDSNPSPAAELAHQLFNYSDDLRVLLLSATPYKMYAAQHEEENHYEDFLKTTRFLFNDAAEVADLQADLRDFRNALMALGTQGMHLHRPAQVKVQIEQRLRRVMCRTERVGATASLDAMVQERSEPVQLAPEDLLEFRCIDRLSTAVGARDPIEYWHSSPYLLNFMKEYEIKQRLSEKKNEGAVVDALEGRPAYRTLCKQSLAAYKAIDPANGRLRTLAADVERSQSWRLLWVPPSMPYWRGEGPYEQADGFTKTLVFSSWNVVPDAIAGLLSYLVEAKSVAGLARRLRYDQLTRQVRDRLRFPVKEDGTFAGMNALALMFPSQVLADLVDPLQIFVETQGVTSLADVRSRVREQIAKLLPSLPTAAADESSLPDPRWYWVALVLLERTGHPAARAWCASHWARARRAGEVATDADTQNTEGGFGRHVQHWLEVWDGAMPEMRRVPNDLMDVLADLALAGPAVCALRALRRVAPVGVEMGDVLRTAAVQVADGLRHQFNAPEAIAVLQQDDDEAAYWKRALNYCANGNLQAVLDEYMHLLYEAEAARNASASDAILNVAGGVFEAASIRTSQLRPDYPQVHDGKLFLDPEPLSLRCRYAVRYGDAKEEDGAIARKESIRAAFNSPFRPFVLASTSVGQEGLDFHAWCHSLVHWNLPGNPVDLEQREGRVHRYKGHAVRKNVALVGRAALATSGGDPWVAMFDTARKQRPAEASDLVPFWIFEPAGGSKVERRVFAMPLSKDEQRLRRLKASLALYRMVFGQPRQDDLMEYLLRHLDETQAVQVVQSWRIDLRPDE